MSARVTKCYLLLCMSFSPPPLTSKLVSFHIILNCVILYTATSATICKFVYFCNALICHLYDFKRIKVCLSVCLSVLKAQNTRAEFANTVDPDEMAHNEPSHQDPQCLPSSL